MVIVKQKSRPKNKQKYSKSIESKKEFEKTKK